MLLVDCSGTQEIHFPLASQRADIRGNDGRRRLLRHDSPLHLAPRSPLDAFRMVRLFRSPLANSPRALGSAARFGTRRSRRNERTSHDRRTGFALRSQSAAFISIPQPKRRCAIMAVEPTARGQGLGGRILDEFEKRARAAGATSIILNAREDAQRFYQKHGFTGRRPGTDHLRRRQTRADAKRPRLISRAADSSAA